MANADTWKRRVAEWRASGLTSEEFAQRRDFAAGTLLWWSSRFRRLGVPLDGPPARPTIALARIVPSAPTAGERSSSGVSVEVGAGLVKLERDFDQEVFSRAVVALLDLSAQGGPR